MGGFGSGNWLRFSSKHLVEKYLELDVRFLNKKGGLDNCRSCICNWRDGSNIIIETRPEVIKLLYATTINGQRQNVNYCPFIESLRDFLWALPFYLRDFYFSR